MMKLAQKMQRQRARWPYEEDKDCHSKQIYRQIRTVRHHKQKMSISPHASKALIHRHVLLRNLLRHALAAVLLTGHEVDRIYRKGGRPLQSSARVEKCKGIGAVASADVFEAGALGWYLKPRNEEVNALGRAKGNRN